MPPCTPWITADDLCITQEQLDADPTMAVQVANAIETATDWIFRATGSVWTGPCTSVLRPEGRCGHEGRRCRCWADAHRLNLSALLGGDPIIEVVEIRVNGEVVEPDLYRVDDVGTSTWLVPQAPEGTDNPLDPWPVQRPNLPAGEVGTWSVEVTHGKLVEAPLLDAAADLARELLMRCQGNQACSLPDNATSISADGMTIQLHVPKGGTLGLPMVDNTIDLYRSRRRRRIHDPAAPRASATRA